MLSVTQLVGFGSGGALGVPPTVQDVTTSSQGTLATSHTVSLPATVDVSDLLIIFFAASVAGGTIGWTNFTEIAEIASSGCELAIAYKQADGTEDGGTETVTTSSSVRSAHICVRIKGHIDPATAAPDLTSTTGVSAAPDPPSHSPASGNNGYLWLAACGVDPGTNNEITVGPSGYSNFTGLAVGGATNGVSCGVASLEKEGASENPGTFTSEISDDWASATVAVSPG